VGSTTHGGLPPAADAAIRHAVEVIERQGLDRYLEEAYPSYVAPRRVNDEQLKRVFVDMAHRVGKEAGLRQIRALLAIRSPFQSLDQICCPTLILGGKRRPTHYSGSPLPSRPGNPRIGTHDYRRCRAFHAN